MLFFRNLFVLSCWVVVSFAQVVTTDNPYPTIDDSLTIIFDATQGNGALAGEDSVFIHTGLITTTSLSGADWKNRRGRWTVPDTNLMMEPLGNNRFRFKMKIRNFYGITNRVKPTHLAFVFRNARGTVAGKNADGSDIYIPLFNPGMSMKITAPQGKSILTEMGHQLSIEVLATDTGMINLFHDGQLIAQAYNNRLTFTLPVIFTGRHVVNAIFQSGGQTITDTFHYVVREPAAVLPHPPNTVNGINYIDSSTVILSLFAPNKQFVYVIGDFNDWKILPAYQMNRTPDGSTYWIQLDNLDPHKEYGFQYVVDNKIRIADPYTEKVLDPWGDLEINDQTYPGLRDYPYDKTDEIISTFQIVKEPYNWHITNFQKPPQQDLVIYELLVRDFNFRHDFQSVIDSLDYLKRLGVNVVQLMPVIEYEGNNSWGYSPTFFFAVDKFYGPANDLKRFIDSAHAKGMAVLLDIVPNHAFGQCPLVRLYWDEVNERPAPDNPWFNVIPTHPFNVGFDFNHESPYTQQFFDRVFAHWIREYKIDGYRLDLTKGLTQTFTGDDVAAWGLYDASRIAILKRIYDHIKSVDPSTFVILEHLAENSEEKELADYGMMLWGKATYEYNQLTMGYVQGSDFSWGVSSNHRGWTYQHLVGFMESHDEERLMYKNLQYGNSNGAGYDIKQLPIALKRMELAGALFFTVPGPKMIWQFGELGYDFSINFNCRTCPKPIRWDYYKDPNRHRLYKVWAALIHLKTNYPALRTSNYQIDAGGLGKRINLWDSNMNVVVIGNMDVNPLSIPPNFPHTGVWYDYLTGAPITVNDVNAPISLDAGEYHIYTDVQLPVPDLTVPNSTGDIPDAVTVRHQAYPNPANHAVFIEVTNPRFQPVHIAVYDMFGKKLSTLIDEPLPAGTFTFTWESDSDQRGQVGNGIYFYTIRTPSSGDSGKFMILR